MAIKLLIADDEDSIRRGIAKYIRLHTDRFDLICEAENGQEAIDLALKHHPDIILLDVQMPLKNGIDVMKEINRAKLNPYTIILSGYDEFSYAQQALRLGAKDYLLKPMRARDILNILEKLIDDYIEPESHTSALAGDKYHHYLTMAQEYIMEHYAENLSLGSVAEVLGISPGYFSTIFSKNLQCGFVDYLNQVRIDRACAYLEQNYLKTYEIAYKVGFNDEKYFSKVFKKIKGISPKEYKEKENKP